MIVGPLTILGTLFLFLNLPFEAMMVLPVWSIVGALIYFGYSRSRSHVGKGHVEFHEDDLPPPVSE